MAKGAIVQIDRKAFYPLMQTPAMQAVLLETAEKLQQTAGTDYEVITENQKRKTRNVIAVGDKSPDAMRKESQSGTLARALASLERPWNQ